MALGPGKYDDLCTYVREQAEAPGVIVMIVDGSRGFGFSIQAEPEVLARLPEALRGIAQRIEDDLQRMPQE